MTTNGGVSIGGSQGETPNAGAATNVIVRNCNFTSGDFYALCAQFNSTVTIESGNYQIFDDGTNRGTGVLQGTFIGTDGPEGTITVTGGTYVGSISKNNKGNVIVQSGTFSVDPTTYVAEGHSVTENNGMWIVA